MLRAQRVRQLFAIHRWTGLLTGLVILFLSLTGTGLVFIAEIDRLLNRDLLVSTPAGAMISADAAVAAAAAAYPQAHPSSIELPANESSVYTLFTNRVRAPEAFNQIMVDPYTAQVRGTRMYASSFAFILRQMHLRFYYFGWKGRVVVGGFGLLLLISTLTGLIIYGRFIRALPHWWSVRRERGFQISTSDWHKLIGITALAFNIMIAVTGTVLGIENLARFSPAARQAIHPSPARDSVPKPPRTLADAVPISLALARACAAIPGFRPVSITLPRVKRSHFIVYGNLDGQIAMERASEVGVHTQTGEVFYRKSAREMPVVTKAYNWMDPLHFGYWGGVASRILYLFLGLTTAFLSTTGIIVWYMKTFRRARTSSAAVRAAAAVALLVATFASPAAAQSGGIRVGANVQVSAAHPRAAHYEVLAAADPANAAGMIVGSFFYPEDGSTAGSIVYATRDGGRSWRPTLFGDKLFHTSDPAPAFGPDGIAYYTASSLGPDGTPREQRRMLMFRSRDGGSSWQQLPSLTYSDRQYVTVDVTGGKYRGRVYVNGNNRVPYGISDFVVFRSADRGMTFQGPGTRPGFGKNSAANMGNAVVASDGTLMGVFQEGKATRVVTSRDGGENFTPATDIDTAFAQAGNRKGANNHIVGLPYMAIDPANDQSRDNLYVVWADGRSGPSRIYFSASSDKGTTWTPARAIDDRAASDSSDAFMPTIAVNRAGVVAVMWYDRREHADNLGWDVRFAASLDHGQTFLPSVKVSEQSTTFGESEELSGLRAAVTKPQAGSGVNVDVTLNTFTYLGGDTNGLVADAAGVFHPFWVDNRTGVAQIWTAPISVNAAKAALRDVSERVTIEVVRVWYQRSSEMVSAEVRLHNTSDRPVSGPFHVELRGLSSQLGQVRAPAASQAVLFFEDVQLAPDMKTRTARWDFAVSNPRPVRARNRYQLGLLRLHVAVLSEGRETQEK